MHNSSIHKIITGILIALILITPVGYSVSIGIIPHTAQAFSLPTPADIVPNKYFPKSFISEEDRKELEKTFTAGVAACAIISVIMYAITPGNLKVPVQVTSQDLHKFLDCVFYQVVNVLIENILRSLTRWAQSGFKGNPSFVTSLKQTRQDIINQTTSEFIYGAGLQFLCSPWKLDIQLALAQYVSGNRRNRYSCTLQDIIGNAEGSVEDFVSGNFFAGGWDGWYDLFLNDNPYTNYLEAQDELEDRINSQQEITQKEIDLGRGFLSIKSQDCYALVGNPLDSCKSDDTDCVPIPPVTQKITPDQIGTISGATDYYCDPEEITTPGAFVENQINEQFHIPGERLAFADELNELISATMTFLVRSVLFDDKGLKGFSFSNKPDVPLFPDVPIPTGTETTTPPGNQYPPIPGFTPANVGCDQGGQNASSGGNEAPYGEAVVGLVRAALGCETTWTLQPPPFDNRDTGTPNQKLLWRVWYYGWAQRQGTPEQKADAKDALLNILKAQLQYGQYAVSAGADEVLNTSHYQLWSNGMTAARLLAVAYQDRELAFAVGRWWRGEKALYDVLARGGHIESPGARYKESGADFAELRETIYGLITDSPLPAKTAKTDWWNDYNNAGAWTLRELKKLGDDLGGAKSATQNDLPRLHDPLYIYTKGNDAVFVFPKLRAALQPRFWSAYINGQFTHSPFIDGTPVTNPFPPPELSGADFFIIPGAGGGNIDNHTPPNPVPGDDDDDGTQ